MYKDKKKTEENSKREREREREREENTKREVWFCISLSVKAPQQLWEEELL